MANESSSLVSMVAHTSPFYLGSQDRPGDLITPVRLRHNNYDEWARSVRLALLSRRKFGFVDGTLLEPKSPFTEEDWLTIHSMLISWLLNTLDPEIKSTISFYDDAKLLWDELKARYSVVDGPKIQQLKSDLAKCEQTKTMSVSTYFGKLKTLWDELAHHEPIVVCKCGKCSCNVAKIHEERRSNERFHQFLMGLNSEYYSQLRTTLLSQDPLPSLDRAYQQVHQEERLRGMQNTHVSVQEVVGFSVRTEGRGRPKQEKPDKSGLMCSHCNRSGHDVVTCFRLLGYPEWWGDRPRNQGGPAGRGKGGSRNNESAPQHGRGRNATVRAVVADPHSASSINPNLEAMEAATSLFSKLSASQWQSIAAIVGDKTPHTDRLQGPSYEEADWNG